MNIDDHDRTVVSRVLSRALPAWADREAAASSAGLRDVQITGDADGAWRMLVDEACERGQLIPLVRAASRLRPDHGGLKRLAAGLEDGRVVTGPPLGLVVGVGAVVVLIGGLALSLGGGEEAEGPAASTPTEQSAVKTAAVEQAIKAPPVGLPAGDPPAAAVEPDAEVEEAPEAEAVGEPTPEPVDEPAAEQEAPEATPAPTPVPTPEPARAAAAVGGSGPCAGKRGYAYLGEDTSLSAGDVWTVDGGANVRADYPRRENGWDFRTSVQCVLPTGSRVRLGDAPIAVDGGAWWVEVTGDRVLAD